MGDLGAVAARQYGLFTRAQALSCGFSAYQIQRRLRAGEWLVVLGSVFSLPGLTRTPQILDRAAALALPGAILAGPAAARAHRMPVDATKPWVVVPRRIRAPPTVGVFVEPVARADTVRVDGLRATNRARTVFDCLRVLPDRAAADLLDRALRQRWTTLDDLAGRAHGYAGRRGAGRIARLVHSAGSGARSAAERLAVQALRAAGIGGWVANAPIHDRYGVLVAVGDLVFREERVVVELDGRAYHVDADTFEADRHRQNRLVEEGWTVLRFTWQDLTGHTGYLVRTVGKVLGHDVRRG